MPASYLKIFGPRHAEKICKTRTKMGARSIEEIFLKQKVVKIEIKVSNLWHKV